MSQEFLDDPDLPPPQDPPVIPGAVPDTNVNFVHYDTVTGEIWGVGHCAESGLATNSALYPDLGFLIGKADETVQMVDVQADPPALIARPVFAINVSKTSITADGVDQAVLSNIPAGTTLTLLATGDYEEASQVVSGSTTVTTVIRQPMTLRAENFPYQDQEIIIHGV